MQKGSYSYETPDGQVNYCFLLINIKASHSPTLSDHQRRISGWRAGLPSPWRPPPNPTARLARNPERPRPHLRRHPPAGRTSQEQSQLCRRQGRASTTKLFGTLGGQLSTHRTLLDLFMLNFSPFLKTVIVNFRPAFSSPWKQNKKRIKQNFPFYNEFEFWLRWSASKRIHSFSNVEHLRTFIHHTSDYQNQFTRHSSWLWRRKKVYELFQSDGENILLVLVRFIMDRVAKTSQTSKSRHKRMLFGIFWWKVLDPVLGMLENDLHTLLLYKNVAWANNFDIMISSFYDFPKSYLSFFYKSRRAVFTTKKSELQNFRYKWLFFSSHQINI